MELECKSQDNGIYSNNVPDNNELLGSVTQQTDSEGGIQLRTSARVSKKLKLDSLAQATQSTTEKKGEKFYISVKSLLYQLQTL